MGLIKIFANNIELDFVRETLSIKKENNAFSRDFKVSASSYPFLIIENGNAKKGLGIREMSSVKKKKIINVIVFEGGNKYYGEIQILSYLTGFRKCNLKYSDIIFSLMNRKISDFMPVVSVIPDELEPVPYSEQSDINILGSENWKTYPLPFLDNIFPEVKWQFPTMKWLNKFGIDLESDDPWYLYNNNINEYDEEGLIENTISTVSEEVTVENRNVVSPQIFLLSPAFYAMQSLGFTLDGDFVNSDFIKRLLIYSNKNNLTEFQPVKEAEDITLAPLEMFFFAAYRSLLNVMPTSTGTYIFEYEFQEPAYVSDGGYLDRKKLLIYAGEESVITYSHFSGEPAKIFKGVVKIDVSEDMIGQPIRVRYYTNTNSLPIYTLKQSITYSVLYHQMHPTIELGRYLPDWTFGTYLNELQNLFNLEITPDDFAKKLIINFNEEAIADTGKYVEKKSLVMNSYDPTPYNAFILKYDNEEDEALWITTESAEIYNIQTSNYSEKLGSKFKYIPVSYTADLSEALDSKNGTGLMIYDPANKPLISQDFLGQTLNMNGNKGIYRVYWKGWLKFLLNSSYVELTGPYTETEIRKILKLKRIYIDHQEYIISATEFEELKQEVFKVKFSLQSITF